MKTATKDVGSNTGYERLWVEEVMFLERYAGLEGCGDAVGVEHVSVEVLDDEGVLREELGGLLASFGGIGGWGRCLSKFHDDMSLPTANIHDLSSLRLK